MITPFELDFLRESNNIENEYDDCSLQDAILAWQYMKDKRSLTVNSVLRTHRILMEHRGTLPGMYKGVFRDYNVMITGSTKKLAEWRDVERMVEKWIASVNETIKLATMGKNVRVTEGYIVNHHVAYEAIHPFGDGNGRTGRIFYNWERIKVGLPIHVIEEYKKFSYYDWFK